MFSARFPKGQDGSGVAPPWLKFIWAVNSQAEIFGDPKIIKDEAWGLKGDYVEEYPGAYVIFPADDPLTVKIAARDEEASDLLSQVFASFNVPSIPNINAEGQVE